jgi:hypothetical protein
MVINVTDRQAGFKRYRVTRHPQIPGVLEAILCLIEALRQRDSIGSGAAARLAGGGQRGQLAAVSSRFSRGNDNLDMLSTKREIALLR